MLGACARPAPHPYVNFTWSPGPAPSVEIRSFPLRRPFIERLDAEERNEAANIIAKTPPAKRGWLRYAFAGPLNAGEARFVIFSTDGHRPDGMEASGSH